MTEKLRGKEDPFNKKYLLDILDSYWTSDMFRIRICFSNVIPFGSIRIHVANLGLNSASSDVVMANKRTEHVFSYKRIFTENKHIKINNYH